MTGVPDYLLRLVPEYERLNNELKASHSGNFDIPACQLIAGIGVVMFIGVQFFHADHPFYGGVGATLAIIAGGRWLHLRGERNRLNYRLSAITKTFMDEGFYPPYRGVIKRAPTHALS